MGQVNFEKIKLIIWDLDDTFWKGVVSEEEVQIPHDNLELLNGFVDRGIVNSISSKNDKEVAEKVLRDSNVLGFFVFNNINWDEKGPRIADKLARMGLWAENTLFIDDNQRNLEEAKHYCPEIMVAGPEVIPSLITYHNNLVHNRW